jgi:hypothetical protein
MPGASDDHVIILSEAHLRRVLRAYSPTTTPHEHLSLDHNSPHHGSPNPSHVAGSSPFLRSVGSITATSKSLPNL